MKEKEKFKLAGFFSPRSAPQSEALSANNRALAVSREKLVLGNGRDITCISRLQLPERRVVASSRSSRSKSLHPLVGSYESVAPCANTRIKSTRMVTKP
jgi:hypothetical protein